MGTRADFYIGRGKDAKWIGSTAWDGYPEGIIPKSGDYPEGQHLFDATNEQEFRDRLAQYFDGRDDVTLPAQGWPWPWENSATTDYAYAFDGGKVYGTDADFWFIASEGEPENEPPSENIEWPDMSTQRMATPGSKRSGVMVFTAG
jgi:hypothetical protein